MPSGQRTASGTELADHSSPSPSKPSAASGGASSGAASAGLFFTAVGSSSSSSNGLSPRIFDMVFAPSLSLGAGDVGGAVVGSDPDEVLDGALDAEPRREPEQVAGPGAV